jgi:pilus assembly protein CpaB
MNKKTLIPLIIGLVMGLLALKLGYNYLENVKKVAEGRRRVVVTKKVLLAAQDMPASHLIASGDVMLYDVPVAAVVSKYLIDPRQAIGKTLKVSMVKFMPVMPSMLTDERGFASLIPKGYMALSVKVDEYSGVGGLLSPGNRVVVLGTFNVSEGQKTQMLTKTVLENIVVRAVGQKYRDNINSTLSDVKLPPVTSVTLLVTPEQAQRLQLAMETGKTYLAMETAKGSHLSAPMITLSEMLNPGGESSLDLLRPEKDAGAVAQAGENHPMLKGGGTKGQPYLVEVVTPNKVEKIYFSSSSSDFRVLPSEEKKPAPMEQNAPLPDTGGE